jgi:hypothetical protein
VHNDLGGIQYNHALDSMTLQVNGSSAQTILSSGNVGIATTTPWAKLSVTNTGTGPSFLVEDSTSPDSSPFIIDASGNVGIGTASPLSTLHLNSADAGTSYRY